MEYIIESMNWSTLR